jgi:hypothetical protein
MQVFINEKSLHSQFTAYNIARAVKTFLSAIAVLNEWEIQRETFTSNSIYNSTPIPKVMITNIIKGDKELNDHFLNNLKSWAYWEDSIQHDATATYTFSENNYVNSSVAEITERMINDKSLNAFLLNFSDSIFGHSISIEVVKAPSTMIATDCVYDGDSATAWLISKNIINPAALYSVSCRFPPKDFQTVLLKSGSFVETQYLNQNRKVYRRIGYNQYWVIDNFHYGTDAHIEVFSLKGKHLGVSDINRIEVDSRYKDKDKTLDL